MPRPLLKLAAFVLTGAVGGALGIYMAVNKLSLQALSHRFELPEPPLPAGWRPAKEADAAARARGEHLVAGILNCAGCHGADLVGRPLLDDRARVVVSSGNLRRFAARARSAAGLAGDAAWVRALRFGLRDDGRALWLMPQHALAHLTDGDLRATVAYLGELPDLAGAPAPPPHHLGALGRLSVAAQRLSVTDLAGVEGNMPRASPATPAPAVEASVGYGAYLVAIGRCRHCHEGAAPWARGRGASPLPAGPAWDPEQLAARGAATFARALAEGRRLDGSPLGECLPGHDYSRLDATEVRALWLALVGSLP